jgi:ribosomal protein S18 acetylase RimI-like enzyme
MSASPVTVRQMQIDDLPAVFHLGERIFTAEYSNLYRTWDQYEAAGLFLSDGELCFAADLDGELAGFLLGTVIQKARTAWDYGHLLWLGVAPEAQGAGVGSKLFSAYKETIQAQGVRMMLVDTQADNEGALRFFRSKGFANPTDHVYLTLNLESDAT